MTETRIDLPQGALELLVLRTLAWRPAYGYAIVKAIGDEPAGA